MSGIYESSTSLSRFLFEHSLPSVVQVLAGCYGNISAVNDNELYVHSSSQQSVVVAETLQVCQAATTGRPARRLLSAGGRTLSLPIDYGGWFELMSVDGCTTPMITSVLQLTNPFPARFLIRRTLDAMTADDVCRGDGRPSRRLSRGEVLTPVRVAEQRLLHCRDEEGIDVYLALSQRGLFSAVNEHRLSSVYSLRALLSEFRLPVIVRVVCGSLPVREATSGVLRLVGIQTDGVTFLLPLRHAWMSNKIDSQALVAVPSRYASQLMVTSAAKEFYYEWLTTDDGLQLSRRCKELIAEWIGTVHVVPNSTAAAAAAAASTTATRSYEGDDTMWSRGPIGNSLDSGLASTASAPSIACTAGADNNDDTKQEDLESEIDEIYVMIRYGRDGVAHQFRARSLDDGIHRGEVFRPKPTMAVHPVRQQSTDVLCASQMPNTKRLMGRKQPAKVHRRQSFLPAGIDARSRSSSAPAVNNVHLLRVNSRPANDLDSGEFSVEQEALAASTGRLSEPDPDSSGQQCAGSTEAVYDNELGSNTSPSRRHQQRARSTSAPVITGITAGEPRREKSTSRVSIMGAITRSIANVFRRIRPRKASETFDVCTGGPTAIPCERYSKTDRDDSDDIAVQFVTD